MAERKIVIELPDEWDGEEALAFAKNLMSYSMPKDIERLSLRTDLGSIKVNATFERD
jgi:hypothetical protein